jgi:putative tryptophan/tyrosine transport system substrate-binding protein
MRRREVIFLGGGAAITPHSLCAQKKVPVIGYLNSTSPDANAPFAAAFRQGLSEAGWVEGQNIAIEYRWSEGNYDLLPTLAADLVGRKVDVIATSDGDRSAVAAKTATSVIPIVSVIGGDPVAAGLIANLAHPGGNLTGVSYLNTELTTKRLEMLSELVPQARVIALLVNPNNPGTDGVIKDMQEAARAKGVELYILKAAAESEIGDAFATYTQQHASALVVQNDPLFALHLEQILALASRFAVPAIEPWREFADAGGLISYGPSLSALLPVVKSEIMLGGSLRVPSPLICRSSSPPPSSWLSI